MADHPANNVDVYKNDDNSIGRANRHGIQYGRNQKMNGQYVA